MDAPQRVLDSRCRLVVPSPDVLVTGDRPPSTTGHNRYPILILTRHEIADRWMSADNNVVANVRETEPDSGKIFVDEEPHDIEVGDATRVHAILG